MAEPRFISDSFILDSIPYPPAGLGEMLWGSSGVRLGWGAVLQLRPAGRTEGWPGPHAESKGLEGPRTGATGRLRVERRAKRPAPPSGEVKHCPPTLGRAERITPPPSLKRPWSPTPTPCLPSSTCHPSTNIDQEKPK